MAKEMSADNGVTFTFTCYDGGGAPHQYISVYFSCDEGEDMLYQLVAMCGGTIGAVVGAVLQSGDLADGLQGLMKDDAIDLHQAGREIAQAIGTHDMRAFTRRVLKGTSRDGLPLGGDAGLANWNAAYQRNYFEIHKAVWEVLRGNRLFPQLNTTAN